MKTKTKKKYTNNHRSQSYWSGCCIQPFVGYRRKTGARSKDKRKWRWSLTWRTDHSRSAARLFV